MKDFDEDILDPYFCLKLKKFFDEISEYDILNCQCDNIHSCLECKNYVSVEQFDRVIKIKDGEVHFINFLS